MPKEIVFRIKGDGTVETEATGFKGGECTKTTEELLSGLDSQLKKRTFKAEYNVKAEVKGTAKVQG